MKRTTITILCLCAYVFLAVKCDDDDEPMFCSFNYGKVKFLPDSTDGSQVVQPQFDGDQPQGGTFSAEPNGLEIDGETGAINIDESNPDTEYTISFISEDQETRCETSIYISEYEVISKECIFKYEKEVYIPKEVADAKDEQLGIPVFEDEIVIDGTFTVKPSGLDIDPQTGIFSVNGSASGIEYTVTYTSEDGNTSCQTSVIISGIDYLDAIVDVSSPETSSIRPILDAQIDSEVPTGEGFYDIEGTSRQRNLVIDPNTGVIDLRATLQQIDLVEFDGDGQEPAIPPNQFSRKYSIKYSFDRENQSLVSSVEIVIYWFPSEEDIPEELLILLEGKQQYPENGRTLHPPPLIVGSGKYLD